MKLTYLIYDIIKLAAPLIASALLPDGAPQGEIVTVILYALAVILGVDSVQKTVRSVKGKR